MVVFIQIEMERGKQSSCKVYIRSSIGCIAACWALNVITSGKIASTEKMLLE